MSPDDQRDPPIVHGFDVEVRAGLIEFLDGSGKRLAWFPAWEHADRDLRHFITADIPSGSVGEPYEDVDESWRIQIYELEGFVHVLEGDAPSARDFPRAFRVPSATYFAAWKRVIEQHNPVLPLEAALQDDQDPS